ncbi:hypothetical protein E1263_05465 [Kribbella antibiotica]|uniref:Uncharacterized protein n=1 Tax=Kribbella antibiotica TaxID=190195 RepID=A0A4R4ZUB3_9ACTN|nr:hypothetical protein [Kribbella antibiotica]TDD62060.1 hypothetical protein E1263_05465 [Kribbella antibiotica]
MATWLSWPFGLDEFRAEPLAGAGIGPEPFQTPAPSRPLLNSISSYLREQTDADKLQGSVDPQNVASGRALLAAGFTPVSVDSDGLISYELPLDR